MTTAPRIAAAPPVTQDTDDDRQPVRSALTRAFAFAATGLSGFAPNLLAIHLLTQQGVLSYLWAVIVGAQLSIGWNFALLERFVYRRNGHDGLLRRAAQFLAVNNVDLLARMPLITLLVDGAGFSCVVATATSLVAMFMVRFLVVDHFIYRIGERGECTAANECGEAGGAGPPGEHVE